MSNKFTDIFNFSLSIETMESHICNEIECKGLEFGGLKITCGVCLLPNYYECLMNGPEFKHLMSHMELEAIDINDQPKINEAHMKISSLFGPTSIFEFFCPNCKGGLNNVTFYDIKSKLETKLDTLKLDYDTLKIENKNLKTKNTKLDNDITKIKAKLYDLNSGEQQQIQQSNYNNSEYASELALLRSQIEEKSNKIETFSDELKTALATQQSRLDEFKSESENEVKCMIALLNKLTSNVSNTRETDEENDDINLNNTPSQLNRDNNHDPSRSNQIENPDPGFRDENWGQKPTSKGHLFNNPLNTNINKNQRESNENDYGTKLHELHISPFDINVECKDIVHHVLRYTSVKDARSFSVQRLGDYDSRKTFTSFRVSTLDENVYNAIFSSELWSNQRVRPFKNLLPKRQQVRNNNSNRHLYTGFNNPLASQTHVNKHQQSQNQQQNVGDVQAPNQYSNANNHNRPYIPRFNGNQQKNNNDNSNDSHTHGNAGTSNSYQYQRHRNYNESNNNNNQQNQNWQPQNGNFLNANNHSNRPNPFRRINNER